MDRDDDNDNDGDVASGHTYHYSHSHTRKLAQANVAQPKAGAVGTTAGKTLYFNGGNKVNGQPAQGVVSGTPKVYVVYWGSQWGTSGSDANGNVTLSKDYAGGAPAAEALFKGLGTGSEKWSGVMTQYCDGPLVALRATSCPAGAPHIGYPTGGALAGVWYDNSAAEPAAATQAQLDDEALAAAKHFGNTTDASNRYVQYMILSAPGTNPDGYEDAGAGFCAWHTGTWSTAMNTFVTYTNMPYVMDVNYCGKNFLTAGAAGDLDGYTMTLGHEYAETLTDQYPVGGWAGTSGGSSENADNCVWSSLSGYVKLATGTFAMQPTWSNDTNECDLAHVVVGEGGPNSVTVTNPGSKASTVGTAANLQIDANDTAAGAALTYSAAGLPTGLTINASTGLISGKPSVAGTFTAKITATDSTGAAGTTSFTWTITAAPKGNTVTVTNPGSRTSTAGTATSLQIIAKDSSPTATLAYSATGLPAGLSINASTGLISGTPSTAASYSVTVKATDTTGASASAAFTWTVSSVVVTGKCSGQLLLNPGFESAASNWTAPTGAIWDQSGMSALAHTGNGLAWLGGSTGSYNGVLSQQVAIPAGCQATLRYYVWITNNSADAKVDSHLTVSVNGTPVQSLTNLNASSGYVQMTADLSAYAGQTVTVSWKGTEDGAVNTSFFIDDTALTVSAVGSAIPAPVTTAASGWARMLASMGI